MIFLFLGHSSVKLYGKVCQAKTLKLNVLGRVSNLGPWQYFRWLLFSAQNLGGRQSLSKVRRSASLKARSPGIRVSNIFDNKWKLCPYQHVYGRLSWLTQIVNDGLWNWMKKAVFASNVPGVGVWPRWASAKSTIWNAGMGRLGQVCALLLNTLLGQSVLNC